MITVRGLDKRYHGVHAVQDLSFDVHPGRVTGFLGPNGAGKSTTLRLMLGLDSGGGETLFDGRPYAEIKRPGREVGAVLEAKAFHPTRTARDHLRMLAAAAGLPASRADECLATVGLGEVAKGRPKTFSLGMSQRLGLAVALLGDPGTLILDEPANGLDPQGIQWLRSFLTHYAGLGRTVLVSSHLLAEMGLMADDLVVIGQGRLIAAGTATEFVDRFTHRRVFLRTPNPLDLATALRAEGGDAIGIQPEGENGLVVDGLAMEAIGELAARTGAVLHELSSRSASLEQAFLEATGGLTQYDARPADGPVDPGRPMEAVARG